MTSDFKGGGGWGGSQKIGFYKVKIGLRGVKNDSKKSDIIYERSLMCLKLTPFVFPRASDREIIWRNYNFVPIATNIKSCLSLQDVKKQHFTKLKYIWFKTMLLWTEKLNWAQAQYCKALFYQKILHSLATRKPNGVDLNRLGDFYYVLLFLIF